MISSTVMEYLSLIAEIESLKEEITVLKATKSVKKTQPRVQCQTVTGKGVQCKKFCVEGGLVCKVHGKPPKEVVKKLPRPHKVVCSGLNMRGNPCKNKCIEGETWCERHDPSLPPKEKKNKKVVESHNHGVVVEPLVPCDTGGKWVSEVDFYIARNEPRLI